MLINLLFDKEFLYFIFITGISKNRGSGKFVKIDIPIYSKLADLTLRLI